MFDSLCEILNKSDDEISVDSLETEASPNSKCNVIPFYQKQLIIKHKENVRKTQSDANVISKDSLNPVKPEKSKLKYKKPDELSRWLENQHDFKSKTYLGMYYKKLGIKEMENYGPRTDSARCNYGDITSRCKEDSGCYSDTESVGEKWDTSSFYLDFIEKEQNRILIPRISSESFYLSESTTSINKSDITNYPFKSISEQSVMKNTTKIAKPKSISGKCSIINSSEKVHEDATEKLKRLQKQIEYGLTVSNNNRARIIQLKTKNKKCVNGDDSKEFQNHTKNLSSSTIRTDSLSSAKDQVTILKKTNPAANNRIQINIKDAKPKNESFHNEKTSIKSSRKNQRNRQMPLCALAPSELLNKLQERHREEVIKVNSIRQCI